MIFPYYAIPPEEFPRPYLWIDFIGPKGRKLQVAILDSGADVSVAPLQLADELGISLIQGSEDTFELADGTTVDATIADVQVDLLGVRFSMPVAFVAHPGISSLLGQRGIFDRFEIRFRRFREEFEIIEASLV